MSTTHIKTTNTTTTYYGRDVNCLMQVKRRIAQQQENGQAAGIPIMFGSDVSY